MFIELLLFELRYHFRQITFRLSAVLFFGLGMLMTYGSFGGPDVHHNAPYVIQMILCLLSLFGIFTITLACASVVLRDGHYQMEPLVFATGIRKQTYFLVRLTGLLIAMTTVLILALAGVGLAMPTISSEHLGPFRISHFLYPLLVFGIPNIVFCSAILLVAALLTRHARFVYAAGVLTFILYFVASILGNSPIMAGATLKPGGPGYLSILIDPFGFTAFFGETRSWSTAMRNSSLFPLSAPFLLNRLLWLGISVMLLYLSFLRFKFEVSGEKSIGKANAEKGVIRTHAFYSPVQTETNTLSYTFATWFSQWQLDARSVFSQVLWWMTMALWVFFNALELFENLSNGIYGIRSHVTTGVIAEQLLAMRPALLLIVFYAAELVHRERTFGMQALISPTPVRSGVIFLSKLAVLITLILSLITVHIATGAAVQGFAGAHPFQWGIYLSLYYYCGMPLVLFAVLVIFIQTIFSNKYLGMFVSGLLIAIFIFGRRLGMESYLFRFAITPGMRYSDFNGWGTPGVAFHGYMCYWLLLACALVLAGMHARTPSGHDTRLARIRASLSGWNSLSFVAFAMCLVLFAGTGMYIQSQTTSTASERTGMASESWQVAYERKYKSIENVAQPVIKAIRLRTDLFPEENRYTVRGSYLLRNESTEAIIRLLPGLGPDVNTVRFEIPNAHAAASDKPFGRYAYDLQKPLMPGDTIRLEFAMQVTRPVFAPFNSEHSIVTNGTYIELEKFVPHLGYRSDFEIHDKATRQKNSLPERTIRTTTDHDYHFIDFENLITTAADQYAVSPGTLLSTKRNGGRRYFHYRSSKPMRPMFALASARYRITEQRYQGVTFRVCHQPGHGANVPAMMQAMQDAAGYGHAHWDRYPLPELTLAEIPQYPGSATAYPGVIFSQEKINFMGDFSDSRRFNHTYATTAHETAHQWWANRLSPVYGPGDALLTESLAKYTEAVVAEKRFGKMLLQQYLHTDNQLYFAFRGAAGTRELPLVQTYDQPFVHYQKGGLALYNLKEMLGETHVNQALQTLLRQHGYPNHKPLPADLVRVLARGATPAQVKVIEAHFNRVITYHNRVKALSCKSLPDGRFETVLQIHVRKLDETDAHAQSVPVDDDLEVGVFNTQPAEWNQQTKPLYLRKHRFSKSETILRITTDRKPSFAVLDPMGYVLNANGDDGGGVCELHPAP
nr:M1 family aminopeptidase [uncultured Dyadobacter sp.]